MRAFIIIDQQHLLLEKQQDALKDSIRENKRLVERPLTVNYITVEAKQVIIGKGDMMVDERKTSGVTISGGTIGALTTGGTAIIGNINQTINGLLAKEETKDVGAALKALSAAVEADTTVSSDKKTDLLEHLEEISKKAAEPKENVKKSIVRPIIESFATLCAGAGGLATVWQTWGPAVTSFFGI